MMPLYALEEIANALNGRIVGAGLDRVVLKANAVLTVGDEINSSRDRRGKGLGVRGKSLKSMINRNDFSNKGRVAPTQLVATESVTTGSQSEVSV